MLADSASRTRAFTIPPDGNQLKRRVEILFKKAEQQALAEVKDDQKARSRIRHGLLFRFKPYIWEAETIAQQLASLKYAAFKQETRQFWQALVNVVACPDGRISVLSLTDPRAAFVHRVLRGQLPTRLATGKAELPIPANPELRAGIWTALRKDKRYKLTNKKQGKKVKLVNHDKLPRLVVLIGPHIDSVSPTHGCGAAAAALSGIGSGLPAALATLRFGGARNYFRILQQTGEFHALDHFVKMAGGEGTTIDFTHDLYSQGVIVGLADSWKFLRQSESLRQNLLRLHGEHRIILSELLVDDYKKAIINQATKADQQFSLSQRLDYQDPLQFGRNAILIGRVARSLTITEQRRGYPFLPVFLTSRLDEVALRVVAYHLLRNVVYLVLGQIVPGEHWLLSHPEQALRVGPIGADFNVRTIAFIETTPPVFTPSDIQSAFDLYRLMERFFPQMKIDLTREARLVMVTCGFNPNIYKDEEALEEEYDRVATTVIDDASKVKTMIKRAIAEGAAVVIQMIHHTGNRSVIDVI